MRVHVITSCTGKKVVESPKALTLADFRLGAAHVRKRESEVAELLRPAEDIYNGQHHKRLMRGVRHFRAACSTIDKGRTLDLRILSAGYGIVPGSQKLAPYEATFQRLNKGELRRWADQLGVPQAFRDALAAPFDLGLVLLGGDYLDACALDDSLKLGGPTLLFCKDNTLRRLPQIENLRAVALTNAETKRFSCGHVALKGEMGARILARLATDSRFAEKLVASSDVLSLIEPPPATSTGVQTPPKTGVDCVISLWPTWDQ